MCSSSTSPTSPRPRRSCRSRHDGAHMTAAPPEISGLPPTQLLDVVQGFVHELRAAGLPVSMTENLDAMRALEYIPLADRESFKAALGATLVKHHRHYKAFETVFDVY